MLTTAARLLRLLSLLQAHREWTGPELARRLEVSTRTVRGDVERLRELGHPVDATPGRAGGYRLGVGAALPPPLLLDERPWPSPSGCVRRRAAPSPSSRPSWPDTCGNWANGTCVRRRATGARPRGRPVSVDGADQPGIACRPSRSMKRLASA